MRPWSWNMEIESHKTRLGKLTFITSQFAKLVCQQNHKEGVPDGSLYYTNFTNFHLIESKCGIFIETDRESICIGNLNRFTIQEI